MKSLLLSFSILCFVSVVTAQSAYDSIYTFNDGVIAGTVKEVTSDVVKFAYPNEELLNSLSKNSIQKIVFKSGRTQVFSEAAAFNEVNSPDDWEKVSVTILAQEVRGLYKIGDVSVKAKSGGLASSSKIKDRAYNKLKMEAAMQGANVVLISDESSVSNQMGTQYQAGQAAETQLSGISYSTTLPNYSELLKVLDGKSLSLITKYSLGNNSTEMKIIDYSKYKAIPVPISTPEKKGNTIIVYADISGSKTNEFQVTNFNNEIMILMEENKGKYTNYTLKIQ